MGSEIPKQQMTEQRARVRSVVNNLIQTLHKEYGWFNDEELQNTPLRITKFYEEWHNNRNNFQFTTFPIQEEVMVVMTDINFYSMCAHHMLPFFGTVSIAYLPKRNGKVCGASKLVRQVTKVFSKPGTQEPMTTELADGLYRELSTFDDDDSVNSEPDFLMVRVKGTHTCMMIRGVKQSTTMITSSLKFDKRMESKLDHLKSEAFEAWKAGERSD